MELQLFVTCGRGLDEFVKEEIKEKIPGVSDVHSLGEGKVAFSVQILLEHSREYVDCPDGADMQISTAENQYLLAFATALLHGFSLKLVERLFLTIHCEDASDISTDEQKLGEILQSNNLDFHARLVTELKKFQSSSVNRVICRKESCPGVIKRNMDKEMLKKKRDVVMMERCEIMSEKNFKRTPILNSHLDSEKHEYSSLKRKKLECNCDESRRYPSYNVNLSEHDSLCIDRVESSLTRNLESYKEEERYIYSNKIDTFNCPQHFENTKSSKKENDGIYLSASRPCMPKTQLQVSVKSSFSFRISCRIRGRHRGVVDSDYLIRCFVQALKNVKGTWEVNWMKPDLEFYVNITDLHFIVGLTLSLESLSLRPYISHITLRSTTSYLMIKLCHLRQGDCILDPMCGGGTILTEAAKCFKVGLAIGGDLDKSQLEIARCNLSGIIAPFDLLHGTATSIPLNDHSVDAIVCDFPFGQKHKLVKDSEDFLINVIGECCRLLVNGGRAVFLISSKQHEFLMLTMSKNSTSCGSLACSAGDFSVEATYPVSLGRTIGHVIVLLKE